MTGATEKSVKLDVEEAFHLSTAAKWGLLRRLNGLTVCMTGALTVRREDMADLVKACGGRFTNSMTGQVDILLVAQPDSYSTKTKAAQRRGIPIVTELGFVRGLLPSAEELLAGPAGSFDLALARQDWDEAQ